jgi:hypothetical protein
MRDVGLRGHQTGPGADGVRSHRWNLELALRCSRGQGHLERLEHRCPLRLSRDRPVARRRWTDP